MIHVGRLFRLSPKNMLFALYMITNVYPTLSSLSSSSSCCSVSLVVFSRYRGEDVPKEELQQLIVEEMLVLHPEEKAVFAYDLDERGRGGGGDSGKADDAADQRFKGK